MERTRKPTVVKKRKTDREDGASKPDEERENVTTHKMTLDELIAAQMEELVGELAQNSRDAELRHAKFLQVIGAQMILLGQTLEQTMLKQKEKEKETEVELRNALKEKEKAEMELKAAMEAIHEKEKEIMLLKTTVKELPELLKKSDVEKRDLRARVEEMEKMVRKQKETTHDKMCEAFIQGFDRAISQAKFLASEADFSEAHCLKVVMDGKLVDAEELEEESEEEEEEGEGENSV
ncbi:hypothetical protein PIB30_082251 [Stylosanthes scabra]|uniref:Uncharacterized protein n=1 Tax=Stylosanthes scabra TaxID=79078 RepID=A0ABU6URD3_9FABA|nr:hypothetical protein [Stylosanthes scabra]